MDDGIERACAALNHLDAGMPYDKWYRIGMSAKAAGVSFEYFRAWCERGANYENADDLRTKWNSFDDAGGITERTLYGAALAEGWRDPARGNKATHPDSFIARAELSSPEPVKQAESTNANGGASL